MLEEFELWVHQRLGCREASVVVLSADHRRLLVRLAAPALEIVVFVGHAPDALNEEALYDGWEDTEGLLQKATAGDVPFVKMVDTNGHLGSAQSRTAGSENTARQGEGGAGVLLHEGVADVRRQRSSKIRPPERGERSMASGAEFHWTALGDHVDYLLVLVKLALPQAVRSPGALLPSSQSWRRPGRFLGRTKQQSC